MSLANQEQVEMGYEDIFSSTPYYDIEPDGKRLLIHMLYVPPSMRNKGIGRSLFTSILEELPPEIQHIRLRAAELGSGCTIKFWSSLGFTPAYSNCDPEEEGRILHRAVNGFELPAVEALSADDHRHYIFD